MQIFAFQAVILMITFLFHVILQHFFFFLISRLLLFTSLRPFTFIECHRRHSSSTHKLPHTLLFISLSPSFYAIYDVWRKLMMWKNVNSEEETLLSREWDEAKQRASLGNINAWCGKFSVSNYNFQPKRGCPMSSNLKIIIHDWRRFATSYERRNFTSN